MFYKSATIYSIPVTKASTGPRPLSVFRLILT